MSIAQTAWVKILSASAVTGVIFAAGIIFAAGKYVEGFSMATKTITEQTADIKSLRSDFAQFQQASNTKIDTITSRQERIQYRNALQFQSLWNELRIMNGKAKGHQDFLGETMNANGQYEVHNIKH